MGISTARASFCWEVRLTILAILWLAFVWSWYVSCLRSYMSGIAGDRLFTADNFFFSVLSPADRRLDACCFERHLWVVLPGVRKTWSFSILNFPLLCVLWQLGVFSCKSSQRRHLNRPPKTNSVDFAGSITVISFAGCHSASYTSVFIYFSPKSSC